MELLELLREYIHPELLVMLPVLWLLGHMLSKARLPGRLRPWVLLAVSLAAVTLYTLSVSDITGSKALFACLFSILTQGVLLSGGSALLQKLVEKGRAAGKKGEKADPPEEK